MAQNLEVRDSAYDALLRERDALKAALHALVDDDDDLGWWDEEGSLRCPHCLEWLYEGKVEPQHQPDCPVTKARWLL